MNVAAIGKIQQRYLIEVHDGQLRLTARRPDLPTLSDSEVADLKKNKSELLELAGCLNRFEGPGASSAAHVRAHACAAACAIACGDLRGPARTRVSLARTRARHFTCQLLENGGAITFHELLRAFIIEYVAGRLAESISNVLDGSIDGQQSMIDGQGTADLFGNPAPTPHVTAVGQAEAYAAVCALIRQAGEACGFTPEERAEAGFVAVLALTSTTEPSHVQALAREIFNRMERDFEVWRMAS